MSTVTVELEIPSETFELWLALAKEGHTNFNDMLKNFIHDRHADLHLKWGHKNRKAIWCKHANDKGECFMELDRPAPGYGD